MSALEGGLGPGLRQWFCLGLVLCIAGPGFAWADAPKRTLRIATGVWEPWSSDTLPHGGIAARIVREAFAARGISVEVEVLPWARALEATRRHEADASFAWVRTDEREQEFLYGAAVYEGRTVLFHHVDRPVTWQTLADLGRYRIGVSHGYSYGSAFDTAVAEGRIQVDVGPHDEANLRKLLAGRVDAVPIEEIVGLTLLRRLPREQSARISYNTRSLHAASSHLIVHRQHPLARWILDEFQRGMNTLRDPIEPRSYLDRFVPLVRSAEPARGGAVPP